MLYQSGSAQVFFCSSSTRTADMKSLAHFIFGSNVSPITLVLIGRINLLFGTGIVDIDFTFRVLKLKFNCFKIKIPNYFRNRGLNYFFIPK